MVQPSLALPRPEGRRGRASQGQRAALRARVSSQDASRAAGQPTDRAKRQTKVQADTKQHVEKRTFSCSANMSQVAGPLAASQVSVNDSSRSFSSKTATQVYSSTQGTKISLGRRTSGEDDIAWKNSASHRSSSVASTGTARASAIRPRLGSCGGDLTVVPALVFDLPLVQRRHALQLVRILHEQKGRDDDEEEEEMIWPFGDGGGTLPSRTRCFESHLVRGRSPPPILIAEPMRALC